LTATESTTWRDLADDVGVQMLVFCRGGQLGQRQARFGSSRRRGFFVDDLAAEIHALVTDIDSAGPGDQPSDLVLAFATKGAVILTAGAACCRHVGVVPLRASAAVLV
jgi:hypothetical protein